MYFHRTVRDRTALTISGVTIHYPHDTIRIAILESRYDSNLDTC